MNSIDSNIPKHALNGYTLIPETEAVLPLRIREVFFNFSVYESIKIIESIPLFLQDHIDRLFTSAQELSMSHEFSSIPLTAAIHSLIDEDSLKDATLRIQLVGGDHPYLFVFSQDLPEYKDSLYEKGVSVISYEGERIEPEVKSNCLLLNYLALREAREKGAFEAILVDRYGMAIEGTRSNVFGIQGNTLYTPGSGVLAGVTRKHILEAAESIGMEIAFTDTSYFELRSGFFDEFFISSTSMGAMPVSMIDDVMIGKTFPKTHKLHEEFSQIEQSYIADRRLRKA